MAKKHKTVADGVLRVPAASSPEGVPIWLAELDMWADAYLREDPSRPGADELKKVKKLLSQYRRAAGSDPERAMWAAMHLLHTMWIAQMHDAKPMIDGGVTAYRASERENRKRSLDAAPRYDAWQKAADEIWKRKPNLSVKRTAELIAQEKHDAAASTIRQAIKKPTKI